MKYFGLFAVILLLVFVSCRNQTILSPKNPTYNITVKIDPEKQYIAVSGNILLPANKVSDTLSFYLHRQFDIESFSLDGNKFFRVDSSKPDIRYMPEAVKIYFLTQDKRNETDITEVNFSYSGTITQRPKWLANIISPEWTEIGLYLPWFPYHPDYRPLEYKLSVEADTPYRVFALGNSWIDRGMCHFKTSQPTNDIVICVAKDLKKTQTSVKGNHFQFLYYSLEPHVVDSLMKDVETMYRLYSNWFGNKEGSMCLVESKRKSGGAYGRLGGLFLPGFENADYLEYRNGYLRYLGHELAHNWWYSANATSWHDWLNESFAEYSALMLIRDQSGMDEYKSRIEKYAAGIDTIPPLWGLNRDHKQIYRVLYRKGPVLLSELEKKIGSKKFFHLCHLLVVEKVEQTDDLIKLLENETDADVAAWFVKKLKTR